MIPPRRTPSHASGSAATSAKVASRRPCVTVTPTGGHPAERNVSRALRTSPALASTRSAMRLSPLPSVRSARHHASAPSAGVIVHAPEAVTAIWRSEASGPHSSVVGSTFSRAGESSAPPLPQAASMRLAAASRIRKKRLCFMVGVFIRGRRAGQCLPAKTSLSICA